MGLFDKKKPVETDFSRLRNRTNEELDRYVRMRQAENSLGSTPSGKEVWCFFYGWAGPGHLRGSEDAYRRTLDYQKYVPSDVRRNLSPDSVLIWRFDEWSREAWSEDALACLQEFGLSRRTDSRYMGTAAERERFAMCDAMKRKVNAKLGVTPEESTKVYVTKKQGAYDEVFVVAFKVKNR